MAISERGIIINTDNTDNTNNNNNNNNNNDNDRVGKMPVLIWLW